MMQQNIDFSVSKTSEKTGGLNFSSLSALVVDEEVISQEKKTPL